MIAGTGKPFFLGGAYICNCAPQLLQNAEPTGFCCPQLGQFNINSPPNFEVYFDHRLVFVMVLVVVGVDFVPVVVVLVVDSYIVVVDHNFIVGMVVAFG